MKTHSGTVLQINKIADARGSLCFIEKCRKISFEFKRIYYIYDVPNSADRGAHAHKKLRQIFIAISGSFVLKLFNGNREKEYFLNDPSKGLYVGPNIWRTLYKFSSGAVVLVLASNKYNKRDYIRRIAEYKKYIAKSKNYPILA
jgi:dTDP-4-dehydrorhamnose 3,5-epimerase-like enzyme